MEADYAAANQRGSTNRGLDVRRTVSKTNLGWVWDSGPP